jgi:hypothetical protein
MAAMYNTSKRICNRPVKRGYTTTEFTKYENKVP